MLNEQNLTFEQLPKAVALLLSEVEQIKTLLQTQTPSAEPADQWFNLQALCDYLPDKPAKATVYGWIAQHLVPHHKKGKKLQFLKSEIDAWLKTDRRKTQAELMAEAEAYVKGKKGGQK